MIRHGGRSGVPVRVGRRGPALVYYPSDLPCHFPEPQTFVGGDGLTVTGWRRRVDGDGLTVTGRTTEV